MSTSQSSSSWECPQCGSHNFGNRSVCLQCGAAHPPPGKMAPAYVPRPPEMETLVLARRVTPEQPASPPPAPITTRSGSSRSPRLLFLASGGLLVLFCACCAGIYAFREPIQSWLVNIALNQGWGEIVSSQDEPGLILVQPPTPTSPPPPVASVPADWQPVPLQDAGVTFYAPRDFELEPVDGSYVILVIHQPDFYMLDAQVWTTGSGGTNQSEIEAWMEFQNGVAWGEPTFDQTPVGPLAWSVGPNLHGDKIFGAVIGPTRSGAVITFWGQAPQDQRKWDEGVELYLRMARSMRFTDE